MIGRLLRRRPSTWLVVAGALALLAAIATMRAAASGPTEPVLVAARDLTAGSRPADTDLEVLMIPAGAALPGQLLGPDDVAGRMLVTPVRAGEAITQAALGGDPAIGPRPLEADERAVSIPASAAGATVAALVPGARVDVAAPDAVTGRVRLVVRNAEVIAVVTAQEGDTQSQEALLLRVSADEALALSGAGDQAGVRVIVRPFDDAPATEVAP